MSGVSLVVCGIVWCGSALAAPLANGADATFDHPRDPATVVIKYTERLGGIAEADTPSVTVYGDGRTIVHWPLYTKRRGDYETRLGQAEMQALVGSVVDNQLLSFDPDAVRQAKRAATAARRSAGGEVSMVSDDAVTTIEVNLDRATTAAGGQRSVTRVHKEIVWSGVRTDARQHPEIASIHQLAQVEERLHALRMRSDLVRTR